MKVSSERNHNKGTHVVTIEYSNDEWLFGELSKDVKNIFWAIMCPGSDGYEIQAIFSTPALAGEFTVQLKRDGLGREILVIPIIIDPKTIKESEWWRAIKNV